MDERPLSVKVGDVVRWDAGHVIARGIVDRIDSRGRRVFVFVADRNGRTYATVWVDIDNLRA